MLHYTVCPRKKSRFRNDTIVVKCALLCLWEFKLASTCKTNSIVIKILCADVKKYTIEFGGSSHIFFVDISLLAFLTPDFSILCMQNKISLTPEEQ